MLRKMSGTLVWIAFVVLAALTSSDAFVLSRLVTTSTHQRGFSFTRMGRRTSLSFSPVVEKGSIFSHQALTSRSLPWSDSLKATRNLTYMPMLVHHLAVMKELGMKEVPIEEAFSYQESKSRPARIASLCFQNEKFRKVRFTYFDAGDAVQVWVALTLSLLIFSCNLIIYLFYYIGI